MNHSQTIKTLAAQTDESILTVERMLKSYEQYCNKNFTRCTRKHIVAISESIAAETQISTIDCAKVMTQFFNLINSEIKTRFF